jgi:hypothetical protein
MNTSKRLELANLIALRLRGINIEDSIAQAADGDGDSDSADATPNTPGMHRNVGRAGAPQSDSDSDDNGADDSAAGAKPRVRALAFQSEKVQSQDSDESSGDSSSGALSPPLQRGEDDVAAMRTDVINDAPNGHVRPSDSEEEGDGEDGGPNNAAQLGQAAGKHAQDDHLPSPRAGNSQSPSPEKLARPAVAATESPSTEDSSEHLSSPDMTPSSPSNPSTLSLVVSAEAEVTDSAATSPQPCTPSPAGDDAASESARLALNREKEYEAKLIMQLSEDVTSKLVLNRGATFLKHGRSGDPHYRFVWVSSDFKRIHWGDADTRNSKFMRFEDVSDVQAGKNTAVFQRSYGSKFSSIPESMCFSVVSGARTLDLQADSVERRNFWVQNLFVLFDIERRKADELKRQRIDLARDQQVSAHILRWRAAFKQWETTKTKPLDIGEITLGGVPSSLRSKVWPRAIGNQLQITRQLYDIFKTHAKNARSAHARGDANAYVSHEASISVLYKDLPRTFAELGFFHNGGPLEQPLREVLESYIFFRPDVGYVQGMSFIAAMLLLYVEPFEAFVCFSNMMNSAHFLPFYSMDLQHIHACVSKKVFFCRFGLQLSIRFIHSSMPFFVQIFVLLHLTPSSSATSVHFSTSSNCTYQRCINTLSTWTCRSSIVPLLLHGHPIG